MLAVYLHHLPQLVHQLGLQPGIAAPTLQHCAASAVTLLLPGAMAVGADWASPLADLVMRALGASHKCPVLERADTQQQCTFAVMVSDQGSITAFTP